MLCAHLSDRGYIRITAEGVLTREDYRRFEPGFSHLLTQCRIPVPLLLEMPGFRGWTVGGLLRDIGFDLRHRKTFSRIAVIGCKRWHRYLTLLATPVFQAPMRFFAPSRRSAAEAWLVETAPDA